MVQTGGKACVRKGVVMARTKRRPAWLKWGVQQNMVKKDEARGLSIVKEFHFYPTSNGKPLKDWGGEGESDYQMCVSK